MEEHPNVQKVKQAVKALRKLDRDTAAELLTEDATLGLSGTNLLSGKYEGVDEIIGFYKRRLDLTDGTFRSSLHDVMANDRHACTIERSIASRNGRTLDVTDATVFHVHDGKVATIILHFFNFYKHEEFWS
jgi:ketosteroid isomerase-like protein